MVRIGIITGSVRPGRFNIQPAQWIFKLTQQRTDIDVELIDLAELNLPFMDEPHMAVEQRYVHDHTNAWSEQINALDGFIIVTPEYNHSISPVLKNAIDYLYQEWNFKPVAFLSYGSQAGGARATEHLRQIAGELKMYDLREQMLLPSYWEHQNEQGEYQFNERHEKNANEMLTSLIFWAQQMKSARQVLLNKSKTS